MEEPREGSQRKKTVLRTFRLTEDVAKALEAAAEKDGITFNALLSRVTLDYVTWVRNAKNFGFVYLSKPLLSVLLEASDPQKLEAGVRGKYAGVLKDMTMYWFQDASPRSLIRYLELMTQHNWYLEVTKKVEANKVLLSFRHDMGPKYTIYLRTMLDQVIRNDMHSIPTFEEGSSSLTVRFTLP